MNVRRLRNPLASVVIVLLSAVPALAVLIEVEPNNPFGSAQIIPFTGPSTSVTGSNSGTTAAFAPLTGEVEANNSLAAAQSIVTGGGARISGSLATGGGDLDFFRLTGFSPGVPFVAQVVSPPTADTLDTVLGQFDAAGTLLGTDDDGGTGLLSLLTGFVGADGTMRLALSGFPDLGDPDLGTAPFIGDHAIEGAYQLDVGVADVDFFVFTGLTAGAQFLARIASGDFDTVLGLFNGAGGLVEFNDDCLSSGLLSCLGGTVPGDGILRLGISGFPDTGFVGDNPETGTYALEVSQRITAVPVPSSGVLLLAGLAALLGRRALRRGACADKFPGDRPRPGVE